jgi:hypothetical protein
VASTNFPVRPRPRHFALAKNDVLKNGRYKIPGKGHCELSTWFFGFSCLAFTKKYSGIWLAADEKFLGANARKYFETAAWSLVQISGTAVQIHVKDFETAEN